MVGSLTHPTVPLTPMARYYARLKDELGGLKRHREEADRILAEPGQLVAWFKESIEATQEFFGSNPRQGDRFYEARPKPPDRAPGLADTESLGRLFMDHPGRRWDVDDDELSFYFVDRELVATRAPGFRLETKAGTTTSTRNGLRLDLLLRNANDAIPILAEVKIARDKDPFFGLIQALTAASYIQPEAQRARLKLHDDKLDTDQGRLDVYVVLAREPGASAHWFDLRDRAEELAEKIGPELGSWVRRIAGVDLIEGPEGSSGLRIEKRFSYPSSKAGEGK